MSGALAQAVATHTISATSANLVLGSAPTPGNVLVVAAAAFSNTEPALTAISGGGVVTWNHLADSNLAVVGGGSGACGIWWGIVGGSPSATVAVTGTTSGQAWLLEVSGTSVSTPTATPVSTATTTMSASITGVGSFGVFVTVMGGNLLSSGPASPWVDDIAEQSGFAGMAYGVVTSSPLAGTFTGGGGSTQAGVYVSLPVAATSTAPMPQPHVVTRQALVRASSY